LSNFSLSGAGLRNDFPDMRGAGAPLREKNNMEARELVRNPKFVAMWVALWACLLLAVENVLTKASLLMQLGQS
jgi:hypothetical protein